MAFCACFKRVNFAKQLAAALMIFGSTCLVGCAQITVVSDQAPPRSEWKFGVLAIDLPESKNTIVQTSGIGLISTPSGATLGYGQAKIVRIGEECRVVITAGDPEAIAKNPELLRLLKEAHDACAA